MNEMWEWGKKQRYNLGSNVEDREEVLPSILQNENEKSHTICPKRSTFYIIDPSAKAIFQSLAIQCLSSPKRSPTLIPSSRQPSPLFPLDVY